MWSPDITKSKTNRRYGCRAHEEETVEAAGTNADRRLSIPWKRRERGDCTVISRLEEIAVGMGQMKELLEDTVQCSKQPSTDITYRVSDPDERESR